MSLCLVEICDLPSEKRGWCVKHYTRWIRHGDPTRISRAEPQRNRGPGTSCPRCDSDDWWPHNKEPGVFRCRTCDARRNREFYLRARYDISLKEYESFLAKQEGVCAICKEECPTGKSLAVDHEHETGRVRGLLCARCNQGLGQFKEDTHRLQTAIQYLEEA